MPPSDYETLLATLRGRRSVRRYQDAPLPDGSLEKLIEAANWAPSANNRQAYRFLAVEDRTKLATMATLVREAWQAGVSSLAEPDQREATEYGRYMTFFDRAPLCLFPYHREGNAVAARLGIPAGYDGSAVASVSAAITHVLLAAHALGLGACWMTGPLIAGPALERVLGIPQGWRLSAVIPVGIPAESPPAPPRRGLPHLLLRVKP
jgi:nitroreductase